MLPVLSIQNLPFVIGFRQLPCSLCYVLSEHSQKLVCFLHGINFHTCLLCESDFIEKQPMQPQHEFSDQEKGVHYFLIHRHCLGVSLDFDGVPYAASCPSCLRTIDTLVFYSERKALKRHCFRDGINVFQEKKHLSFTKTPLGSRRNPILEPRRSPITMTRACSSLQYVVLFSMAERLLETVYECFVLYVHHGG